MKLKTFVLFCAAVLASIPMSAQTTYNFTALNYPHAAFTQLLGINKLGKIAGYKGASVNKGFVVLGGSHFVSENYPGSAQTQVIGINNNGGTAGFYVDKANTQHGFLDDLGKFTNVDFPGTTLNQLLGRNDLHQAAGYYADSNGIFHPYIYNEKGGVFEEIVIPAATGGAQATGINDSQAVTGFYIDGGNVSHGFLLSAGTLTTLDFPGSTGTAALSLNNLGQVVGTYTDGGGVHGFVWNKGTFQEVDDPNGAGETTLNGINDNGVLVGFWMPSGNISNGFIATPAGAEVVQP
jgi:hypothetical protein